MPTETFKILAIDGGGIRGVFPAYILACIQDKLDIDLYDNFDMIAGTSTGSIIASAIAIKKNPNDIVSLYKEKGAEIFGDPVKSCCPKFLKPLLHSKYKNSALQKHLFDEFKEITLGEIEKPLLLPATDIGNGCVHVFKSQYDSHFTRDKNVKLKDAVLASCSAPTFFNPVKVDEYLLADGGVWANNPSLAAVLDAIKRLKIPTNNIKILSIGTGHSRSFYGTSKKKRWGLGTGWKHQKFIEMLLSLQAQSTENYLKIFLQSDQWIRLNFESNTDLPLDNVACLNDLISKADKMFSHESKNISNFINDN